MENDIAGLRKVIDDTNMARLQLEGEIESLKEELIFMKKNHEEVGMKPRGKGGWIQGRWGPRADAIPSLPPQEVKSLQAQISDSALTVEVDAPKSQDLGKIMAEIRAQYDALAQKNLEDLEKQWGQQVSSPPHPPQTCTPGGLGGPQATGAMLHGVSSLGDVKPMGGQPPARWGGHLGVLTQGGAPIGGAVSPV